MYHRPSAGICSQRGRAIGATALAIGLLVYPLNTLQRGRSLTTGNVMKRRAKRLGSVALEWTLRTLQEIANNIGMLFGG